MAAAITIAASKPDRIVTIIPVVSSSASSAAVNKKKPNGLFDAELVAERKARAEAAQAIAQKWMAFTDVIISKKAAALEQKRDVDFEQYLLTFERSNVRTFEH